MLRVMKAQTEDQTERRSNRVPGKDGPGFGQTWRGRLAFQAEKVEGRGLNVMRKRVCYWNVGGLSGVDGSDGEDNTV